MSTPSSPEYKASVPGALKNLIDWTSRLRLQPFEAHKACAGDDLADPALQARLVKSLQAFLSLAEAARHYPCVKRAWVEFLGEPPGAAADRVDVPAG